MHPPPGSNAERRVFAALQKRLRPLFERVIPDPHEPRTVVVIPSLSLDRELLDEIRGIAHYEERLLCMLLLLRLPRTRVVYVTSLPVDPAIVDYYLHLLPGIPGQHARRRLTMLSCADGSPGTVVDKLLARPRMLQRVRDAIRTPNEAHMTCFTVTPAERTLAVRLGIPIFGCDPDLAGLGSKSGSREIFRQAGVICADGFERVPDVAAMADSLAALRGRDPALAKAAVKLEEGTSGKGNALFSFEGCPAGRALDHWLGEQLPTRLRYEAASENWEHFSARFEAQGGVVEAWIEGTDKRSPSMQGRVDPLGKLELISTHDQVLGGASGQVFMGSSFPAHADYRLAIQDAGMRVGEVLRERGALGRYGVDFVSVPKSGGWDHYAMEINLRKGGTTHTFRVLQFLTDGQLDTETGLYMTASGKHRFYRASDTLERNVYRRLTTEDLMDVAADHELHFHAASQTGVFFHLIGALSGFGKLGVVCVADSPAAAQRLFDDTVSILDRESRDPSPRPGAWT